MPSPTRFIVVALAGSVAGPVAAQFGPAQGIASSGPSISDLAAADLDGDGDLDVVACANVPVDEGGGPPVPGGDPVSLAWLEQTEPGRFERHTLERGGRRVSLDVGDSDGDGHLDLVVGSFRGPGPAWLDVWENRPGGSPSRGPATR